jgi:hypothetical protein
MSCPRCGTQTLMEVLAGDDTFYGPCSVCHEELRDKYSTEENLKKQEDAKAAAAERTEP